MKSAKNKKQGKKIKVTRVRDYNSMISPTELTSKPGIEGVENGVMWPSGARFSNRRRNQCSSLEAGLIQKDLCNVPVVLTTPS